ncbi:MAG TPA: hypothetical protein VNT50_06570 [Microbacterium sp.]|uniref:hypothetical protein n=1 Tax=Microbacterium sp. TaxID=51671 RepID=UPI002B86424E|nr:hypothetical protein [Microbacterium sp.]HWI31134.1 hypothetical protein [Microbacterium sp.]
MQRLHYTGDTVLLPDAVSEALLEYASALADTQASAVITVPIVEGGVASYAEILLGPASQLYATHAEGVEEVAADVALVDEIKLRTRRLRPAEVQPETSAPQPSIDLDME